MPATSIPFRFSQHFDFPAAAVYRWATDYRADDIGRFGLKGRRQVKKLCNETLLLTDTFFRDDGCLTKKKLVRLYPERLAWVNTHLSGPNRHSQFLYQLLRLGKNRSRLDFIGRQISDVARPTPAKVRALARALRKEDAAIWKRLARAMKAELGQGKR